MFFTRPSYFGIYAKVDEAPPPPEWDEDAKAFLTTAEIDPAGTYGIVTGAEIWEGIDRFFKDIKGVPNSNYPTQNSIAGIITLYLMVGANSYSHSINAKTPIDSDAAYRAIFYGSPTHSPTGIYFNGVNQFADTLLKGWDIYPNKYIAYYSRTTNNSANWSVDAGARNSLKGDLLTFSYGSPASFVAGGIINGADCGTALIDQQGLLIASRTDKARLQKGKTIISEMEITSSYANHGSNTIFGALNDDGAAGLYSQRECCFFSEGNLSQAQLDALADAVEALQIKLKRNV